MIERPVDDLPDEPFTVWPCAHGEVLIERGDVPQGHTCAECGAKPLKVYLASTVKSLLQAERERGEEVWKALYDLADAVTHRPPGELLDASLRRAWIALGRDEEADG